MSTMTVRVTNAQFESIAQQGEFDSVDAAYDAAIESGLAIATEEIRRGERSVIVEVAVDVVGKPYAARGAVAVSTSRLLGPEG